MNEYSDLLLPKLIEVFVPQGGTIQSACVVCGSSNELRPRRYHSIHAEFSFYVCDRHDRSHRTLTSIWTWTLLLVCVASVILGVLGLAGVASPWFLAVNAVIVLILLAYRLVVSSYVILVPVVRESRDGCIVKVREDFLRA